MDRLERISPPFRYQGSQVYALDFLLPEFPEHTFYVEPFCGGASTFFGKPKTATILNDIDSELIGAYILLRDKPKEVIEFLRLQRNTPENYDYLKHLKPRSSSALALKWIFLNAISDIKKMNTSWERDSSINFNVSDLADMLYTCSEKLMGVSLISTDFEEVIRTVPQNSFIYASPPYSIQRAEEKLNEHKFPFRREDHYRLASVLRARGNIKFLLTYNENNEIKEIYSWANIKPMQKLSGRKQEIMIKNY